MGVNLPAHLVVLKGTRRWSSDGIKTAGYQEYDRTTCLQMIGRAGRPQFDTEGVAVIMTQKQARPAPQLVHLLQIRRLTTFRPVQAMQASAQHAVEVHSPGRGTCAMSYAWA